MREMTDKKRQGNYGQRAAPVKTKSKIMSQVFALAKADGIYIKDICDDNPDTISNWRRGENCPNLMKIERIIDGLGYEIILQKK